MTNLHRLALILNISCFFYDKMLHITNLVVKRMNIMLVEDDRIIASGLQYSLEQEQYSVVLAYTYTEAKDYIEKHIEDIHLFIFDLNLPDGTGYDLCTAVKQRQDKP